MKIAIPQFKTIEEKFAYLKENKDDLLYQKKESIKHADGIGLSTVLVNNKSVNINKGVKTVEDSNTIKVRAIINTTSVLDSHDDVHIKGIWNKTVKENKRMKHIQEHKMAFDKIIADKEDLRVSIKTYSWKDLGVDAEGETEALVFDSTIKEERNGFMYNQYKDGNVDNHSVGMRYVKMKLAINSEDEDYAQEKEVYDTHIEDILNKDEVEAQGYFWAIYEAKAIEGSAVPMGSNTITPTIEPSKATQQEEEEAPVDKAELDRFKNLFNI